MPPHPASSRKAYRLVSALAALVVAGTMGALLIALASSHTPTGREALHSTAPTATLNKIQEGNAMAATQYSMAETYGPLKTVIPQPSPPATQSSCPRGMPQSGISPYEGGDDSIHDIVTTVAVIAPTPAHPYEYEIFAGEVRSNSPEQQGLLIVYGRPEDPCASGLPETENRYLTPYQKGALTITQINGESITFSIAQGGTGQFNCITGQFS